MRQWEKGYVAGVIDSDGMISMRPIHKSYSFSFLLQATGTKEQMEKLKDMTGIGSVYFHSANGKRRANWRWNIWRKDEVLSLLNRIYPFLTKKSEANLVFKMAKLHRANGGRPISEANFNARFKIFQEYKALKCRNGGSSTNWGEFRETLRKKVRASKTILSEASQVEENVQRLCAPPEREEIVQAQ